VSLNPASLSRLETADLRQRTNRLGWHTRINAGVNRLPAAFDEFIRHVPRFFRHVVQRHLLEINGRIACRVCAGWRPSRSEPPTAVLPRPACPRCALSLASAPRRYLGLQRSFPSVSAAGRPKKRAPWASWAVKLRGRRLPERLGRHPAQPGKQYAVYFEQVPLHNVAKENAAHAG